MANIEINLTLEGEEALRVLQAILNKGAEVSVTQTPVVEQTTEKEKVASKFPLKGGTGLNSRWTDEEMEYLSCMVQDYYAEKGTTYFNLKDKDRVEDEFFALCGKLRTWKGLNVRTSVMRGRGDARFFPEGIRDLKRKKTPTRS